MQLAKQIAVLRTLCVKELQAKYLELFGEASGSRNKDFLVKRIAWRMQSLVEGGLSERARNRAMELAREADLRLTIPKSKRAISVCTPVVVSKQQKIGDPRVPMPGTVLTRYYKGHAIIVSVLDHGFEYEGRVYPSLSAVAKVVTGTNWNGYLFFKLSTRNKHDQ